MAITACTEESIDHLANLRRLVGWRWFVLAVLAILILTVPTILDIPVPQVPLLGIIAVAILFNALAQWRVIHSQSASTAELFTQLLFDIGAFSAIVFFSGGATNPLVSLLLPPVAVAALTLPGRCVAIISATAIVAYSVLMVYFIPLPMSDATRATRLHLIGMWLIFVISAAIIGWIIVRMTTQIRERDAELAATREQALRDERIMAMGTLAAGAAHELGTPLGTMALLAGELANDPALPATAREDIALLRQQIAVCKKIITGLSRRAGAERLENAESLPADRWLENLRQHWHAARPQASSRLVVTSDGSVPDIVADPRLEQALLNLLNNAANATPIPLEIGPGFPPDVLSLGGQRSFPAHERGSGVGLILTRTAIEQLGGRLSLLNPDDGGAIARIELPRAKT